MMLTDEQLRAVGCLSVESALVEQYVDFLVEDLCGLSDGAGRILLGGVVLGAKTEMMEKLLRPMLTGTKFDGTFRAVCEQLSHFLSLRKAANFSEWVGDAGPAQSNIRLTKKRDAVQVEHKKLNIDASEVMAIARGLARCR